jgi:hypothetical protein
MCPARDHPSGAAETVAEPETVPIAAEIVTVAVLCATPVTRPCEPAALLTVAVGSAVDDQVAVAVTDRVLWSA